MNKFKAEDIRAEVDIANETIGNKIRKAINEKIPYVLVIGDKEVKSDKLTVRVRDQEKLRETDWPQFIKKIKEMIQTKSLSL
jgi:threonyl-tRNA synthetase